MNKEEKKKKKMNPINYLKGVILIQNRIFKTRKINVIYLNSFVNKWGKIV